MDNQSNSDRRSLLYLRPPTADSPLCPAIEKGGWTVDLVENAPEAVERLSRQRYAVGLVQWEASGVEDTALHRQAEQLLNAGRRLHWVAVLSGATRALEPVSRIVAKYFYDFHTLPVDADRLLSTLGHAHGMAELTDRHRATGDDLADRFGMVGKSPPMRRLFEQIRKVAAIDLNVLVRGESGTGKELTALAVHRSSNRADGPFVAVNCGALPKDLIQAELFGHEKGAFTGADRRRTGRIEAARNGTLFLDEIGDLPLDLQTNLLRFLQEKTIDRVGSPNPTPVDVRVIAATNVNLERAVEEGRFREDLYYRLNVLHLELPPLRERGDDVALLASHLFERFASTMNPQLKGFSQQAMDAILAHPWPGNVREMVNRIQRAVVMSDGRLLKVKELGLDRDVPSGTLMTLAQAKAKAEKETIETTLKAVRNNVSKAARYLGVSRVTLYRLMELHSIDWQQR